MPRRRLKRHVVTRQGTRLGEGRDTRLLNISPCFGNASFNQSLPTGGVALPQAFVFLAGKLNERVSKAAKVALYRLVWLGLAFYCGQ